MTRLLFRQPAGPAAETPNTDPREFHMRLPDYAVTPLHGLPEVAAALGLGRVWAKDESSRLGLPKATRRFFPRSMSSLTSGRRNSRTWC